jgi:hypothetical protein
MAVARHRAIAFMRMGHRMLSTLEIHALWLLVEREDRETMLDGRVAHGDVLLVAVIAPRETTRPPQPLAWYRRWECLPGCLLLRLSCFLGLPLALEC